jgi:hypothetical protein
MSEERRREINTDDVVERVFQSGSSPGETIKLKGRFLGNSETKEHYRLYVTEELNHYLEFPKDRTLDAARVQSGRVVVWVKAGTPVKEVFARTASEDFLRGDIYREHSRGAAGGGAAQRFLRLGNAAQSGCVGSCSGEVSECPGPQCW